MIEKITKKINEELNKKPFILVAIDGRCASGKTTLANKLKELLSCNVINMDDFFLRPSQRTSERLSTPGENIDHERFLTEVIPHLRNNEDFSFHPFDCHLMDFGKKKEIKKNKITIIEGSYSCHPKLWDFYNLHIFLDIDYKTQLERIEKRNGKEILKAFEEKWIPFEEAYFKAYNIKDKCEIY